MKLFSLVKITALCAISLGTVMAQAPDALIDISSPLFDSSVLHDVHVTLSESDWKTLQDNFTLNTSYQGSFEWAGQTMADVSISSQGNSGRLGTKPSLRISFDQTVTGRKFAGQKSVILLNISQDASMLRDYLSMQMFRQADLAAPRDAYARVIVNGVYLGLYLMREDIDTPLLGRTFFNNSGWLYEYKLSSSYHFEDRGTDPGAYAPSPFELKTNKKTPNTQALVDLVQVLNHTTPETFIEDVAPHLDINRFLQHVAMDSYLAETDGLTGVNGMNNLYLYQPGSGSDPFQLIAWDKSAVMNSSEYPLWMGFDENIMLRIAMKVPSLRERYLQHLRKFTELAGGEGGWLEQTTRKAMYLTAVAAAEDTAKPFSNDEYDEAARTLLSNIRARYAFMDEQLKAEGQ